MTTGLAAVTGATGFLGRHLVRALAKAGYSVRTLARRPPEADDWGCEIELVRGGLEDAAALDRLVDGASVVVHAAGAIKAADASGFLAVNRDGAARLAAARARGAPGARLLLVSSLAARAPALSGYAASKRAGEEAVALQTPADLLTIVRPPAIYGPGDRETLTVFRAAATSPVLPIPAPEGRIALVHVEDAAAQIVAMAGGPSGTFALADGRPSGYSWREVLEAAAEAAGARPWLVAAPPWVLPGFANAAGFIARMGGGQPLLSREKVQELLHPDWSISDEELAADRPSPRFGLKDGFAHTLAWYREAGWLPKRRAKSPH